MKRFMSIVNGHVSKTFVELGTHDELMNIPDGQYKSLYEMQFKKQKVSV
jgi:hypothetical protein